MLFEINEKKHHKPKVHVPSTKSLKLFETGEGLKQLLNGSYFFQYFVTKLLSSIFETYSSIEYLCWVRMSNWISLFPRVVHGTYLSVPSHSNLCLSHPMGFPLHYYNINMEYISIKIIKFMKV